MRKVKGEKEMFEKEAAKIPGLQTAIEHLQTELGKNMWLQIHRILVDQIIIQLDINELLSE